MQKIWRIITFLVLSSIIVGIIFEILQYRDFLISLPKPKDGSDNYVIYSNYAVQIGYNIAYISIAIVVVFIAYFQLNKTREATTIQTLINIDNYIRSDDFLRKRKKLAILIMSNEIGTLSNWLKKVKTKDVKKMTYEERQEISFIKNIFEAVIYQFELIGHFYKKHIFSIEDVYQLFSIEIQQYWILMCEIGYIDFLRENKNHPNEDFYDKFQNLYIDTIKQEIINHSSNKISKGFRKIYYWTGVYKVFYRGKSYIFFKRRKNKFHSIKEEINKMTESFLLEEKNLI